jgi:hypothetical protein
VRRLPRSHSWRLVANRAGFVSPPHDSPSEALQISTDVILSAVMLAALHLRWLALRSLLTTPAIFNDLNLTIDTS